MNKVDVSVIVPVYGVEKYIGRFIDSLIEQELVSCEFILVNDASLDGSDEIIKSKVFGDSRFKYLVKEVNEGEMSARQTGFEISTGDYIINLDSDDYIAPGFLVNMYNFILENKLDIATCNVVKVNESGEPIPGEQYGFSQSKVYEENLEELLSLPYASWCRMVKREVLLNNEYSYLKGEIRLARLQFLPNVKSGHCAEAIHFYRQRGGSLSGLDNSSRRLKSRFSVDEIARIYLEDFEVFSPGQISRSFAIFRCVHLSKLVFVSAIRESSFASYLNRIRLVKRIYNVSSLALLRSSLKYLRAKESVYIFLVALNLDAVAFILYKTVFKRSR
ncbi:glycosyltransferase family 2 protein [Shewanella indica]|uniref:glycosyltransferase family 2 protein n=1 Tax=Shewanella indica TaxID=768528 RepID=UPI003007B313